MRVICINGIKVGHPATINGKPAKANNSEEIIEGEIYNVLDVPVTGYYRLHESPATTAYGQNRFIPCSEIDELELVNEKQLCQ